MKLLRWHGMCLLKIKAFFSVKVSTENETLGNPQVKLCEKALSTEKSSQGMTGKSTTVI